MDTFVLVIDASLSMGQFTAAGTKLEVARAGGEALAATVPEEGYRAGVRSFGQGGCLPADRTWLLWGMERWDPGAALRAIGTVVCADGFSRLDLALAGAETDMRASQGRAALIVISDGMHMGERTVNAAEALSGRFGSRLCLWPIHVGDDRAGSVLLERLAQTAGCGRVTDADELANPEALEAFVREALLEPDADGDGVADRRDRCPGTPRGVRVDDRGCPLDSAGDGVFDDRDRCPGTPPFWARRPVRSSAVFGRVCFRPPMTTDARLVLCTVPGAPTAERIATAVVEERLAACVNALAGVASTYRWQGKVERAAEVLLVMKCSADRYPLLEARVRALHPYTTPEVIALANRRGQRPLPRLDHREHPPLNSVLRRLALALVLSAAAVAHAGEPLPDLAALAGEQAQKFLPPDQAFVFEPEVAGTTVTLNIRPPAGA